MKIQQVEDKAFSTYGRVLKGYALSPLLKAMEHTPLPKGEVIYVPGMEELEDLPVANAFKDRAFGGLPIQVGFCNGFNTYLNAVEYPRRKAAGYYRRLYLRYRADRSIPCSGRNSRRDVCNNAALCTMYDE